MELHPTSFKLHGKSYDYKILYKHIALLFLLPGHDGRHVSLVLTLDPKRPLRRGQTTYPHLVMVFPAESELEIKPNLSPELAAKYGPAGITGDMHGPTYRVVQKLFKAFTGKPILRPDTFRGAASAPCIKCSYKADEGHLYPMDKYFFFIHKPPVLIRYMYKLLIGTDDMLAWMRLPV